FGAAADSRAPRNARETALAELFAEVVGVDSVGIDDSFFALGGDSIVSIQLVARAKARGIVFTPRDVFEHKTVAGLAAVAAAATDARPVVLAELPGAGVGWQPLLPIARATVERGGSYSRYVQTLTLGLPAGIDRAGIVATIDAVLDRHDILRSRLVHDERGWGIEVSVPGSIDADTVVRRVELPATVSADELSATASQAYDAALAELDPSNGVMLRFVWFDFRDERPGMLLVVLHHLVVDGVSWRILVTDLVTAWAAVSAGRAPALPAVGTSVRRWAHALAAEATDPARVAELDFWRQTLDGPDPVLGNRAFDPQIDVVNSLDKIRITLPSNVTQALLGTLPGLFRGGVNDGLLAGLALAVLDRRRDRSRSAELLLQLEGHGREEAVVAGADLVRTVGWFTTMFPVRIDLAGVDLDEALAGGPAAGDAVKAVKEQLLAVPDKGIGYGLLRYLNPDTAAELAGYDDGQISFNYLGRVTGGELPADLHELGWLPTDGLGPVDAPGDPDRPANKTIDINAIVADSAAGPVLDATFTFPPDAISRADVQQLADAWQRALTALTDYAARPDAGGLTPSDVPLVQVSQAEIDRWTAQYPTLADIWPLAPLQSGLLFHALLADRSTDVYLTQIVLDLAGAIDPDRLRSAAQMIIDRHPNLRAAFTHDGAGYPVQLVLDDVTVRWQEIDLAHLDAVAAADEVDRLIAADQVAPFGIDRPPLMRFTLIRSGAGAAKLVVTSHHIVLDGWSMPVLLQELLVGYATEADSVLPAVAPYRGYLQRLHQVDREVSLQNWATAFSGADEPTLIAGHTAAGREITGDRGAVHSELDVADTERVAELAARLGITTNTVVQAVWAILLGRLLDRQDIAFGATVSGRPADLAGVESMVGLFINTLPVRLRFTPGQRVADVLVEFQAEQAGLLDHQLVGLVDIQQAAGPGAEFDTLVVFESYPVDAAGLAASAQEIDGLSLVDIAFNEATHYPLTLVVRLGARLSLELKYFDNVLDEDGAAILLNRFDRILHGILTDPTMPVADLDWYVAGERTRLWELSAPTAPLGSDTRLVELIDQVAARQPDAVAVQAAGLRLTYAELVQASRAVASWLERSGTGVDDVVGVAIGRSVEWVVALLGVWRAGAAYLPVDPQQPAARVGAVLSGAGVVGVLVADEATRAQVAGLVHGVEVMLLDPATALAQGAHLVAPVDAAVSAATARAASLPGRVAYVITTSGSTGRPKPVLVPMAGFANTVSWFAAEIGVRAGEAVVVGSSPTFDLTQKQVWAALLSGARLVLAPAQFDAIEVAGLIADAAAAGGAGLVNMSPSAFGAVVEAAPPGALRQIRTVVLGGESIQLETLTDLLESGVRVLNSYGPTEASDVVAYHDLAAGERLPVPIGRAIPGIGLWVLDSRLRPVPVGVPGELYVSGVGVGRGYVGMADNTIS
ncbi:condensation domain-containing protein, partial [Skermania pinensis]